MKALSAIAAVVGVLFILLAIYGRFHGATTIAIGGENYAASSLLLVANTALLLSVVIALLHPGKQS